MLRETHNLFTISVEKTSCKSEAGLTIIPDLTFNEGNPDNYEVLIIPGGDLQPIAEATELFSWVKNFADHGKIVAAICSGVYVLAKSDILKGVPYTATLTREQRDFLGSFEEENFFYKPFVTHKNILTAQGHAYVDFGIELNKMVREVSEDAIGFYMGKRNIYMEGRY